MGEYYNPAIGFVTFSVDGLYQKNTVQKMYGGRTIDLFVELENGTHKEFKEIDHADDVMEWLVSQGANWATNQEARNMAAYVQGIIEGRL